MTSINILVPLSIFLIGELISNLVIFKYINTKFGKVEKGVNDIKMFWLHISIIKGILERAVLFIGLNFSLITILVAFGAIKIGTRLKQDDTKISNDYFLVGNLTSILIALGYHISFLQITTIQ